MQGADHVVNRFDVPIGKDLQVDFGRARADVIGDGKGAAPIFRSDRSFERRKQR